MSKYNNGDGCCGGGCCGAFTDAIALLTAFAVADCCCCLGRGGTHAGCCLGRDSGHGAGFALDRLDRSMNAGVGRGYRAEEAE